MIDLVWLSGYVPSNPASSIMMLWPRGLSPSMLCSVTMSWVVLHQQQCSSAPDIAPTCPERSAELPLNAGVHQGPVEQAAVMQVEGLENNVRIFGMLSS